jgi:hypothetical protein
MTATTLTTRLGHEQAAFATHPTAARLLRTLANIALFFAAPFIGLAYIALMPFVGLGLLVWNGFKALEQHPAALRNLKTLALTVTAPFIGLAFIVLLPFIGLVTLATVEMTTPAAHR